RRFLAAVLAAQALAVLELLFVLVAHGGRLASVIEAEAGTLWLAPALLAVAALSGLAGGALGLLLERGKKTDRILLAVLVGAGGFLVGFLIGGGRHLATFQARCVF